MRTAQRSNEAFTIIELLVGMLALSVLVLTVGIMLVKTWQGWHSYQDSLEMQRNASVAMRIMSREIRNSKITEIFGDASGLQFIADDVRTNDFVYSASEIAYSPNVALKAWSFPVIDLAARRVTVEFTLENSRGSEQKREQKKYTMTIYTRNH